MQPVELWLDCTCTSAVEDDSQDVIPSELDSAPAVNGFVRYVEAVSAEPLEYWLYPSCDIEYPSSNREALCNSPVVENDTCTLPVLEADAASFIKCVRNILCQPDSLWVISADWVNNDSTELSSPLVGFPLCLPSIAAVSNDCPTLTNSAYASNCWLYRSSKSVSSDGAEVVINVTSGTPASFEFISTA